MFIPGGPRAGLAMGCCRGTCCQFSGPQLYVALSGIYPQVRAVAWPARNGWEQPWGCLEQDTVPQHGVPT